MNANAVENIRRRLTDVGAEAYIAYTPSNIRYVTGFGSYFVSEWWRMHGTVFAVVPADPGAPIGLVVSDFESQTAAAAAPDVDQFTYRLWVDLGTAADLRSGSDDAETRPEQYDDAELVHALTRAISSAGTTTRVATDLRHLTHEAMARVQQAAPDASLVDFCGPMYDIRAVKEGWEVEQLRLGVELSEAGMTHAAASLTEGLTAREVRLLYQAGVIEAARADARYAGFTDSWVLPTVGRQTSASYGATNTGLVSGDLVKFDCGATVGGYRSDGGRTFAYGTPSDEAQTLYGVLQEAQALAREALVPGTKISEAFAVAIDHVHRHGFPGYNRGHVGHSIGIDTFHEEPPFISASCEEVVRPNMVFAVELPSYTPDVGAIMIEDLIVTTHHDPVCLHTLTHDLVTI